MRKLVLVFTLFCFSCSESPKSLGDIDLQSFRADMGGCENQRFQMISHLKKDKDLLLGKNESEVRALLGK